MHISINIGSLDGLLNSLRGSMRDQSRIRFSTDYCSLRGISVADSLYPFLEDDKNLSSDRRDHIYEAFIYWRVTGGNKNHNETYAQLMNRDPATCIRLLDVRRKHLSTK